MQHDTTPRIARFTDPDGTPCVGIPLSKHQPAAEPYADEYDWLMEQTITDRWYFPIAYCWAEGEDR